MNRYLIPALAGGCFFIAMAVAQAADEAIEVPASTLDGAPEPAEPVGHFEPGEPLCRAVDPVKPGTCYNPAYAGNVLCQPQCIPYARCRTGSSSCQLGNTSPVQWFYCEEQRGYTSVIPEPGSLLAIGIHRGHHITTGHTLYVEEVCPNPDGTYKLRVSHTNYDRRCHLEENALVQYDPETMEADFLTGNWAPWGENLPVQGFILQHPGPPGEHRQHRQHQADEGLDAAPAHHKASHKAVKHAKSSGKAKVTHGAAPKTPAKAQRAPRKPAGP